MEITKDALFVLIFYFLLFTFYFCPFYFLFHRQKILSNSSFQAGYILRLKLIEKKFFRMIVFF